jgi:mRNA-degrading endonuclease YafQ of YafQ-DinJ toxin-antitoxin module
MRIALPERFQRDVRGLEDAGRAALFDVMLALPSVIGDVHRHRGLGIRKLHRSGIWEARIGLGLRLVFTVEQDLCTLVRVGTHEDIQRYLRSL